MPPLIPRPRAVVNWLLLVIDSFSEPSKFSNGSNIAQSIFSFSVIKSDNPTVSAPPPVRKILRRAIKYGGSSINDYVSPDGTLGNFQKNFKVYGRAGYKIKGCEIKKVILHGRSTFFCPDIQK